MLDIGTPSHLNRPNSCFQPERSGPFALQISGGGLPTVSFNLIVEMIAASSATFALPRLLQRLAPKKENETRAAFGEYARWLRERDRKCDLDDKDNVPLNELSPPAACLADFIKQKTAEVLAAKGDPKRVFGRVTTSPTPDADAVDLCVAQIHSANTCHDFLRVSRIIQVDTEVSAEQALVTAEIEMKVLSPFGVCSPIASGCTGSCWDVRSGQPKSGPGSRDSLPVAHRMKIDKSFAFQKTAGGGWRCNTPALQPIEFGIALGGL